MNAATPTEAHAVRSFAATIGAMAGLAMKHRGARRWVFNKRS
jgi:hypothetical protein